MLKGRRTRFLEQKSFRVVETLGPKRISFVALILSLVIGSDVFAVNTDTLPKGIISPTIRYGFISGLEDSFSSDGGLYSNGDLRSVRINATTIQGVSSQANQLINAINSMGSQNLGSQIDLGTVYFTTAPEVQYYAFGAGYGITDRWSVGAGAPMIHYRNRIGTHATRGNKDFYAQQFPGLSSQLDATWQLNLVSELNQTLAAKGYRPMTARDQSFMGDLSVSSLYRFAAEPFGAKLLHHLVLTLPTGPKYDPDDLLAINQFGQTSISNALNFNREIIRKDVILGGSLAYVQPIPDRVDQRVPKNDGDLLPDASSTEKVHRLLGSTVSGLTDISWLPTEDWKFTTGYQYAVKTQDHFSGEQGHRYDLLSRNTNTQAQRFILQAQGDTIRQYRNKSFAMPLMAQLTYSDTFAGVNTARAIQTELNLILFF